MAYTFFDLKFSTRSWDGAEMSRINFPNGWGLSVIRGPHSYGGRQGLYEAAVLCDGDLNYDSGLADDVIGWQTMGDITVFMNRVAELPPVSPRKKDKSP